MTPTFRRLTAVAASTGLMTIALAGVILPSSAQEPSTKTKSKAKTEKGSSKETEKEEDAKSKTKAGKAAPPDVTHRVPPHFAALNLTTEQRESIYKLEAKYQPKIKEMQEKLDATREQLMTDCEDVLTAPQKKALAEARKEAAEKRKAASKADEKADEK